MHGLQGLRVRSTCCHAPTRVRHSTHSFRVLRVCLSLLAMGPSTTPSWRTRAGAAVCARAPVLPACPQCATLHPEASRQKLCHERTRRGSASSLSAISLASPLWSRAYWGHYCGPWGQLGQMRGQSKVVCCRIREAPIPHPIHCPRAIPLIASSGRPRPRGLARPDPPPRRL